MQFDVIPLIEALGIAPLQQIEREVYARCPGHDDTGKPNWSINLDSGQHHCWSCGYGGSLLALIAKLQGFTWGDTDDLDLMAARTWARRFRSKDLSVLDGLQRTVRYTPKAKAFTVVEKDLYRFKPPPEWALEARQLTAAGAEAHGVLWDPRKDAWITTIRDPWEHQLRGWQVKGQTDREFRNYPIGVDKATTLFGLPAFPQDGTAILVESPLDVVRLESIGITGGLATYGAAVSEKQLEVLRGYADELLIAMDNPRVDKAGKASTLRLVLRCARFMPTRVLDYDHTSAKDIGDMTDAEIVTAIANSRHGWRGVTAVHS